MAWTSGEVDMAWTSSEQRDDHDHDHDHDHGHCYGHAHAHDHCYGYWEEQSHASSEAQVSTQITDPKQKDPRWRDPASVSGRDDTSGDGLRHSRGSTLPRSSIA